LEAIYLRVQEYDARLFNIQKRRTPLIHNRRR